MSRTSWIIFTVIVVALFGGLIIWTRTTNPPVDVSTVDSNSIIQPSADNGNIGDFVKGKADSKVILIEYADFQCPSCAQAYPNTTTLMDEYGDRVAFVFRNFPLTSIHPNARAAAGAAIAASQQGKFWEMYDALFENHDEWTSLSTDRRTDVFTSYALQIGLEKDRFLNDLSSDAVNKRISFDLALAKAKSITATPTFYVNGEPVDDETSSGIVKGDLTKIKALLDKRLAE